MNEINNPRRRFLDRARNIAVEHFENSAHEYDAVFAAIDPVHAECLEEFLRRLGSKPTILDAACGTGRFFDVLSARAGRLIGVDQSGPMLDKARSKRPDIETRLVSLQGLGEVTEFRAAIDGLVCVDAMEWVMSDDWPLVLAGFKSVLVSGGYVYLTIEIPGEEETRELSLPPIEGAVHGEIRVHSWYNHFPRKETVVGWVSEAGFEMDFEMFGEYYWHVILQNRD